MNYNDNSYLSCFSRYWTTAKVLELTQQEDLFDCFLTNFVKPDFRLKFMSEYCKRGKLGDRMFIGKSQSCARNDISETLGIVATSTVTAFVLFGHPSEQSGYEVTGNPASLNHLVIDVYDTICKIQAGNDTYFVLFVSANSVCKIWKLRNA